MPEDGGPKRSLDDKFWIALGLYGVLGVMIWFSLGDGATIVFGRPVQLRWIPLAVVGTFLFRTVMAREAEKIRRAAGAGKRL